MVSLAFDLIFRKSLWKCHTLSYFLLLNKKSKIYARGGAEVQTKDQKRYFVSLAKVIIPIHRESSPTTPDILIMNNNIQRLSPAQMGLLIIDGICHLTPLTPLSAFQLPLRPK
jgi:hypothetical protein